MLAFWQSTFDLLGAPREPEAQSPRDSRSTSSEAMEPPFIEDLSPDNIHVLRGKNFSLKAKFVGEPTPNVRWYRQKEELESGESSYLSFSALNLSMNSF